MSLQEQVEKIAAEYLPDPPQNEADTCHWVVYPLLLACGYAPRDISSQRSDAIREFPDYTLLLNAPQHTWFVEAKAWNVMLEDRHAQQALNYTNSNGKRWVVLTNGRVWRLYDNDIRGVAGDKVVMQAQLSYDNSSGSDELLDFLRAVSKDGILAGKLQKSVAQHQERQQARTEAATRQEREDREHAERETTARQALHQILPAQLQDQDSELIEQMCLVLQRQDGLHGVTNMLLAKWFKESFAPLPIVPEPALPARAQSSQENAVSGSTMTLQELAQASINGKQIRPTLLTFPDNSRVAVRSWVDMAHQAVMWVCRQGKRPQMPFAGYNLHRWFLNTSPHHPRNPMRGPKTVTIDSYVVYMDTDMTGRHFAERLVALCLEAGIDPREIKVALS